MKRILYVSVMSLIIMTMLHVSDANAGVLRITISGDSEPVLKPVAPETSTELVAVEEKPELQHTDDGGYVIGETGDLVAQSIVKTCGEPEDYNLPASERFDDVGNGLFVDRYSCSMWPKSMPIVPQVTGYEGAEYYCGNYSQGGYTDWSVPNALVLYSLVDHNKSHPAFLDYFPPADSWSCDSSFPGIGGSQWGTDHCNVWSNSDGKSTDYKLYVNFTTGEFGQMYEGMSDAYTWCVRSVAAPGMLKGIYYDGNLSD